VRKQKKKKTPHTPPPPKKEKDMSCLRQREKKNGGIRNVNVVGEVKKKKTRHTRKIKTKSGPGSQAHGEKQKKGKLLQRLSRRNRRVSLDYNQVKKKTFTFDKEISGKKKTPQKKKEKSTKCISGGKGGKQLVLITE